MEWDQIENKWAAMTRRIRADYAADRIGAIGGTGRESKSREAFVATLADTTPASATDSEFKTTAK